MFVGYRPRNTEGTYQFIKDSNRQVIVTRNYQWIEEEPEVELVPVVVGSYYVLKTETPTVYDIDVDGVELNENYEDK